MLRIATFYSGDDWLHTCALRNLRTRESCPRPGATAELFRIILSYLALPYELVPWEPYHGGTYENGTWVGGVFGDLQNGQIDIMANLWMETPVRRQTFEFSFPVTEQMIAFLTTGGKQDIVSSGWLLARVFEEDLWLYLFALYCLIMVLLLCHRRRILPHLMTQKLNIFDWHSHRWSVRILQFITGMSSVLFVSLYSGSLLTQLMHPPVQKRLIDEWHMLDLIESKELTLLLYYAEDVNYELIQTSDEAFYERFREVLKVNPVVIEPDWFKLLDKLNSTNYVTMISSADVHIYLWYFCDAEVLYGENLYKDKLGFLWRKDWEYAELFNEALLRTMDKMEIIIEGYKAYANHKFARKCLVEEGLPALRMVSLTGAFGQFMVSCVVGMICLGLEFLRRKCYKSRKKLSIREGYELDKKFSSIGGDIEFKREISSLTRGSTLRVSMRNSYASRCNSYYSYYSEAAPVMNELAFEIGKVGLVLNDNDMSVEEIKKNVSISDYIEIGGKRYQFVLD